MEKTYNRPTKKQLEEYQKTLKILEELKQKEKQCGKKSKGEK